jgi:hypothetical protein
MRAIRWLEGLKVTTHGKGQAYPWVIRGQR